MHVFWQLSWHPNSLQSHWLVSKWVGIPLIRLNKAFLWNRVDLVFKVHNGILWKDCCYFCLICSSFETPRKVEMLTCSETCCYAFKIWFYSYFEWLSLTILYFSPGVWEEINPFNPTAYKRGICKKCRSRSAGFWRSCLIRIYTVCHAVCGFYGNKLYQKIWLVENQ